MKRKIIMDCDPGHDDTITLISAGVTDSPPEVLAVTIVAGNRSVDKNVMDALNVLGTTERQGVIVAKGADRPLVKLAAFASEIHGKPGLGGPKLPSTPSRQAVAMPVSGVIINKVMMNDTPVTIVTTGPSTNVATALIHELRITEHTEPTTLTGGGTFKNWTSITEFNTWADAEAAKRIFEGGAIINVSSLDVTHQVLADERMVECFESINNPITQFVVELLQFFKKIYRTHSDVGGGPIHDACAVLYLLQPESFTIVLANIDIEHQGPLTYGAMAVDLNHAIDKPANAYFATAVDVEEVWDLIDHKLRTCGQQYLAK